jgi:hypothetical protein
MLSNALIFLTSPSLANLVFPWFLGYSPESPRDMSPEAGSPYPDRPIRPLPKKPLRERISPDVAQSIKYPPAPKTTTPLFYYGYNLREDAAANGVVESQHPSERERADEIERTYISRRNGEEFDSDEDEQAYRSRIYSRPLADPTGRSYRYVQKPDSKHPNPQPPASTASSADGYDSFENTNNKKKRKIPTPSDSNLNGVHLSKDMAGMGISGPDDLVEDVGNGVGSYHISGGAVQGISGPGRGRYGRSRNGRSPLRTLSDTSSNWGNGRTTKQRQPQWPSTSKFSSTCSLYTSNRTLLRRDYRNNFRINRDCKRRENPNYTFTRTRKRQYSTRSVKEIKPRLYPIHVHLRFASPRNSTLARIEQLCRYASESCRQSYEHARNPDKPKDT